MPDLRDTKLYHLLNGSDKPQPCVLDAVIHCIAFGWLKLGGSYDSHSGYTCQITAAGKDMLQAMEDSHLLDVCEGLVETDDHGDRELYLGEVSTIRCLGELSEYPTPDGKPYFDKHAGCWVGHPGYLEDQVKQEIRDNNAKQMIDR